MFKKVNGVKHFETEVVCNIIFIRLLCMFRVYTFVFQQIFGNSVAPEILGISVLFRPKFIGYLTSFE